MGTQPTNPVIEGPTIQGAAVEQPERAVQAAIIGETRDTEPPAKPRAMATRAALRRMPPRCVECGYDLSATARSGVCPECGRSARLSICNAARRWMTLGAVRTTRRAFGIGTVSLGALGVGACMAGVGIPMMNFDPGSRLGTLFTVAPVVLLVVFALAGFIGSVVALAVDAPASEPKWMHQPKVALAILGMLMPILWGAAVVASLLAIRVEPRMGLLVVPVNAMFMGVPAMLAARWAIAVEMSLGVERDARRAAWRHARWRERLLVAWCVVSVPAQWLFVSGVLGFGVAAQVVASFVIAAGGLSFGLLILDCARSLWRASGRLRVLAKAGRPAI
jgi:predicted RNA-binding Zn-ribbon protein involved in translation (DUF1610 family)